VVLFARFFAEACEFVFVEAAFIRSPGDGITRATLPLGG
jgi:hypothetical protein